MERRPQPPRRPWKEVADSIAQFRNSYAVGAGPKDYYDRVRVIHVTWNKDHLPDFIATQLEQSRTLEETFRNFYKYETKRVELPHGAEVAAYNLLAEAIRQDTEQLTKNDLLILHYQGHGEYTIRNKFDSRDQKEEWQFSQRLASSSERAPEDASEEETIQRTTLDFTKLRENFIDNAPVQVLMLMDCCHAAAAACGPLSGKELLAASSVSDMHPEAGKASWEDCSFTNNVNNILRHAYDTANIMPTSQLYARLYANYWTRKEIGDDVRKLETEPVHMLLHEGVQTPIILAPLRGVVSHYRPALDVIDDKRLPTVRVDCFVNDAKLDAYDIQRYLKYEQGLSGHITVKNVYQTGSYVVELEMSVSTWCKVSRHPDLHFRYVKGPKQLNPPEFSFHMFKDHPNRLTIRPKSITGPSETAKPPSPVRGADAPKENQPWT